MKVSLGRGKLNTRTLAEMVGGRLFGTGREFSAVATDSREAAADALFLAIRGERTDGHGFIGSAYALGCRCVLCERIPQGLPGDLDFVVTGDVLAALPKLAARYCRDSAARTVGVTGSVGKTTTRDLVYSALSMRRTYKTRENYNSLLGLPLSMLEMTADCEFAVLEMGMSGRKEISALSRLARPELAIITNIGSSHLEMLGTRENIRAAKLEITEGLRENGTLIINGDDKMLTDCPLGVRTVSAGLENPGCDFRAVDICEAGGGSSFALLTPSGRAEGIKIPVRGRHNVLNASLAFAAASLVGIGDDEIKQGLAGFRGTGMRLKTYTLGDFTVIEDCYNAAPESMRAAIDVAVGMAVESGGRAVALLGDMKELGESSSELHRGVGEYAVAQGVKMLVTYGELAAETARGARSAGLADIAECEADPAAAAGRLLEGLRKGDILLVKASRSMTAERVIEKLREMLIKDDLL